MPKSVTSTIFAAAVLLFTTSTYVWSPVTFADPAPLSVNHWSDPGDNPATRPSWSVKADSPLPKDQNERDSRMAAGDGRIFTVKHGVLTALDATTGNSSWRYGSKVSPQIAFSEGTIYGTYEDGRIYAVSSTGKEQWISSRTVAKAGKLIPLGHTLYVLRGIDIFAFDTESGGLKWEYHDTFASGGYMDLMEQDGVVFRTYPGINGLTVTLKAFDAATGTKLWEQSQQNMPILIRDDLVYSVTEPHLFAEPEAELILKKFDIRSGTEQGKYLFNWSSSAWMGKRGYGAYAMIDGDKLYAYHNNWLVSYDLTKYKGPGDQPGQVLLGPDDRLEYPLMKIYKDRIFYESKSEAPYRVLNSIQLSDRQSVSYSNDNPASQIDIYGNGIYIGQTDGTYRVFDLTTGRQSLSLETGSRNYGPVFFEKGYAIIQTETQFIGIKIPGDLN